MSFPFLSAFFFVMEAIGNTFSVHILLTLVWKVIVWVAFKVVMDQQMTTQLTHSVQSDQDNTGWQQQRTKNIKPQKP